MRKKVFISHSSQDMWVSEQIQRCIEETGAETFLDKTGIETGDRFRTVIKDEMKSCTELLVLFTPWSRKRTWVQNELGMAEVLDLRIVCVFYNVSKTDFEQDGGMGVIDGLDIIDINDICDYFEELKNR